MQSTIPIYLRRRHPIYPFKREPVAEGMRRRALTCGALPQVRVSQACDPVGVERLLRILAQQADCVEQPCAARALRTCKSLPCASTDYGCSPARPGMMRDVGASNYGSTNILWKACILSVDALEALQKRQH